MGLKLINLIIVAVCLALQAQAANMRKQQEESVAGLFVKDANSGHLKFLGKIFGTNHINQFITNKQDFLEQLRPCTQTGNGTGIDTDTDTAADIATIAGVRPIIINADILNNANSNRRRKPNRRRNDRRRGNKKGQIIVIRPRT